MIFTNKKDFFNVKMIIQLEIKQNRFNKFKICLNQENGLMIIKNSTEKKRTHLILQCIFYGNILIR